MLGQSLDCSIRVKQTEFSMQIPQGSARPAPSDLGSFEGMKEMVVAFETQLAAAVLLSCTHLSFQCEASLKKCLIQKSGISALI